MAQTWRRCNLCGYEAMIVYRAADVDGPDWPPRCPRTVPFGLGEVDGLCCSGVMETAPRPGDFAFDLKTDGEGGKGFQKFEVHRLVPTKDGLQQVSEIVDSVHKARAIERDSEQRYRDGEGEPLRFRAYNQDRSNTDVGLFGREGKIGDRVYDSGRTPQKSKKVGTKRHGQKKPKIAVAKGAGASPLG